MNSIIKISEAAVIALHAVAYLAGSSGKPRSFGPEIPDKRHKSSLAVTYAAAKGRGKPGSARELAENLGVSYNHLNKVMQRLSRAGLVLALRGPKGGFTLSAKAEKAKLKDVFEAIDGKTDFSKCLLKANNCKRSKCLLGNLLSDADKEFKKVMDINIKKLIKEII
ncbi:MAG TPA: hypothetical protein DCL44_06000 [Elusimicrobia bacterium]|nr:hypothetical protein [Elusimicrobiota bacterium]